MELSTKLEKIDKNEIARGCLVRKNWKRIWTVFIYGGMTFVAKLISINTNDDTADIEVRGSFAAKEDDDRTSYRSWSQPTSTFSFPLRRKDFTQKMFNRQLFTSCSGVIDLYFGENEVEQSEKYNALVAKDESNALEAEQAAKDYCDKHGIDDESIIEAIVSQYKSNFDQSLASDFRYEKRVYPFAQEKYALACWLGLKDKEKEMMELTEYDWRSEFSNSDISEEEKE